MMTELLMLNLQAGQSLLLGIVPESLGLLVFGVALVGLTAGLRWLMAKGDAAEDAGTEAPNA